MASMSDPFSSTRLMTVGRIERERDRTLIFSVGDSGNGYRVIASKDIDGVKPGDQIEYEMCGFNFGWFLRVCAGSEKDG